LFRIKIIDELWKPVYINGEKTTYVVSTRGRVKNLKTDHMMHLRKDRKGYLRVCISVNGKMYWKMVHQVVAKAFLPNPHNYPQIDHLDCDKTNNDISNLEWVTNEENMRRATENDLRPSKLTKADVVKICTLLQLNKFSDPQIADMIGNKVTSAMIGAIRTGKSWKRIRKEFSIQSAKMINAETAEKVCAMLAQGYSNTEVAKAFNMSPPAVGRIRQGKAWVQISKKYVIPFKPRKQRNYKCKIMFNDYPNSAVGFGFRSRAHVSGRIPLKSKYKSPIYYFG